MNAQEQYSQLCEKFESYRERFDGAYLFETDWDITAVRMYQDLEAKIDAYGDKAYGLSEKQMGVIERYLNRWLEIITAKEESRWETKMAKLANAINEITDGNYSGDKNDANYIDAGHEEHIPFFVAKQYMRGDINLSEARELYRAELLQLDIDATWKEIYGGKSHWRELRAQRNYHVRLQNYAEQMNA